MFTVVTLLKYRIDFMGLCFSRHLLYGKFHHLPLCARFRVFQRFYVQLKASLQSWSIKVEPSAIHRDLFLRRNTEYARTYCFGVGQG